MSSMRGGLLLGLALVASSDAAAFRRPSTDGRPDDWVEGILRDGDKWHRVAKACAGEDVPEPPLAPPIPAPELQPLDAGAGKLRNISRARALAASSKLTTGHCVRTFGSQALPSHTCRFRNLYAEVVGENGAVGLTAHVLEGFPSAIPALDTMVRLGVKEGEDKVKFLYHVGSHALGPIWVKRHASLEAFEAYLEKGPPLKEHEGVTLAFRPLWHFNIGHALYDGLYPAFVSLVQWGLQRENWRTLLFESDNSAWASGPQARNEQVFDAIGGGGLLRLKELPGSVKHRFETFVIGVGANGNKMDYNSNFTLGAGRELNAAWWLRRKVYSSLGIVKPRRKGTMLRGIIVHNRRFKVGDGDSKVPPPWVDTVIRRAAQDGVKLDYVNWEEQTSCLTVGQGDGKCIASTGAADFRRHIKLISQTHIHISAPGTAMMYQQFLPDGSVHVNLGNLMGTPVPQFWEEHMAEGAPYIRALYYWPTFNNSTPNAREADRVVALVSEARRLVASGFKIPVPVGANLSPLAQVTKAYLFLTQDPRQTSQLTPLRLMHHPSSKAFNVSCFGTPGFADRGWWPSNAIVAQKDVGQWRTECHFDTCLLGKLMENFGEPCTGCTWFQHGVWFGN